RRATKGGPPTAASATRETTPSSSRVATAGCGFFPGRSYWVSSFLYLRCFCPRRRFYFEGKFMIRPQIHPHVLPVANFATHQPPRQRRLHFFLDGSLQGPRAKRRIVADPHQILHSRIRQFDADMPLGEPCPQSRQLNQHNLLELCVRQALERDNLVHP